MQNYRKNIQIKNNHYQETQTYQEKRINNNRNILIVNGFINLLTLKKLYPLLLFMSSFKLMIYIALLNLKTISRSILIKILMSINKWEMPLINGLNWIKLFRKKIELDGLKYYLKFLWISLSISLMLSLNA